MLTGLRSAAAEWMRGIPVSRPPVIRRCDREGWLLATDLPLTAYPDDAARFLARAEAAGWRWRTAENGWLLLDAWEQLPVAPRPDVLPAGETGAALSLLIRHPGSADPAETVRQAAKAAERGAAELARCCGALHRQWAECLRRHEELPGAALPWLSRACTAANHRKG